MRGIVLGDGPMGRAVAAGLRERGEEPVVLGRPPTTHPPGAFADADVVFEFSRGTAVLPNLVAGLAGGCRTFVVGTTAWVVSQPEIGALLTQHGAAAVVAVNFSPGVNVLGRLVGSASRMFGALPAYDPYLLEWHRRGKADRPSGTALELGRRILEGHPVKRRFAAGSHDGPPAADELEVVSVRAGSSPGMHLVGFDAPGESIEIRLTARDRSAYAMGAVAAADWLLRSPRRPGIHSFDRVVDELIDVEIAGGIR
ncbi:MAG TPA: dihydrodipicolinate reductase C-terminal domain-containing protein [Candidatus Acidoferrales bacterium]|nr:dihydrodipicolinate reductase C-terminal domain-containing protein [Candidatus Acidoferrales bacterium]